MEKTIVTTGKTIDEAIENALNQLGLDRDSVSVQVLAQAKTGFLGFGASPAKVQVNRRRRRSGCSCRHSRRNAQLRHC